MTRWHKGTFIAALLILLACRALPSRSTATVPTAPLPTERQQPFRTPTTSALLSTPRPAPTPPVPDSGWQTLHPNLERRVLNLISEDGDWREHILLLRIDPAHYRFDVRYRAGEPRSLTAWQAETGALLVVNGGFFTEQYQATGLVISEGQSSGVSYIGFGGMFAVTENGPELRSLLEHPYTSDETVLAALQSFPMLLTADGQPAVQQDDGERARRTVVAQDSQGRIIFFLSAFGHFTLYELSHYLSASDLDLQAALNLDGGTSSGLILADPLLQIPAFALLPTVITVHERP